MNEAVDRHVCDLVGKPLVSCSRAVDMEMFLFGRPVKAIGRGGRAYLDFEYRLHVQSAWRIAGNGRIVVGYTDQADPPSGVSASGFDPNEADLTRRDELLRGFLDGRSDDPRRVVSCTTSELGDLRLEFDDGHALEVFADASVGEGDPEYWRLLLPDRSHVVRSGRGIEYLPAPEA